MAFNNFTVTEVTYNFTATVTVPLELTLQNTATSVRVTNSTTNIVVNNNQQPITISGVGGSAVYNQSLNTTDNVAFNSVTTDAVYGTAGAPVEFPNGISVQNFGVTFAGSLDFSGIYATYTNILSLLLAAAPIDMGTITIQTGFNLDFGAI